VPGAVGVQEGAALNTMAIRQIQVIAIAVMPNRRKWSRIIGEIKAGYLAKHARPLTDYKLGQIVGVSASAIAYLESTDSAQPKHYEGEVLLKLHAEYAQHASDKIVRSQSDKASES
jgi:hypothetical protein